MPGPNTQLHEIPVVTFGPLSHAWEGEKFVHAVILVVPKGKSEQGENALSRSFDSGNDGGQFFKALLDDGQSFPFRSDILYLLPVIFSERAEQFEQDLLTRAYLVAGRSLPNR